MPHATTSILRVKTGHAQLADYQEKLQRNEPFPSPKLLASLAELSVITGESVEVQEANCDAP